MKNYSIVIKDEDIRSEVYRITANAAAQRGDAQSVATEDNNDLMDVFIADGKRVLEKALGRYSAGTRTVEKDGVAVEKIFYSMPESWPDRHGDVDAYAEGFLKNYATAKWYELNGTGERFMVMADEMLEIIVLLLNKRNKPI